MDQDGIAGSAALLRIATSWEEGLRLVSVVGPVDVGNNHQLHAALSVPLRPDRPLIADLSQVTYMDSYGLSTLRMIQRNADLQGARVLIVPSPAIAALLALTGTDAGLTVCRDLRQALAAVRSSAQSGEAPPA